MQHISDFFKKRNPAMDTPNLCEYYYRMTDLVASQLFHLTDIVKANSAIRGSNLEDTFTVTLKLSEDGFGIVQARENSSINVQLQILQTIQLC